jgi:predicted aspartyl protease
MQEEMLEEARQLSSGRYKTEYTKSSFRSGYTSKGIMGTQTVEEQKKSEDKPPWSDQLRTLKAQRRARGECFRCGEKYQPGHKCAKTVALNVVEELLELLQVQSSSEDEKDGDTSEEETLMKISYSASTGTAARKTIRLQGYINGKQVLILVDSGSSGSFVSEQAVADLGLRGQPSDSVQVVVADGAHVACSATVPEVIWQCQGNVFASTMRVFALKGYDVILGMDWLESCGDMWISWEKKTIRFRHQGKRITLKGIKDRTSSCS